MSKYQTSDIRNFVLCGHSGSGKTTLSEAMLMKAGAISRMGSIHEGTTVSDYDSEEQARHSSLFSSFMHCSFKGRELNILDTPGSMDFIGGMIGGMCGADLAVICINATKGVELMARKSWETAGKMGLGRIIAICRMNGDNVNYRNILENIRQVFGERCIPFALPEGEGTSFKAVRPVFGASGAKDEEAEAVRNRIIENAIESDDKLMEQYLEKGEVSAEQVAEIMPAAIVKGTIFPVFPVAAESDIGVSELMEGIATYGPTPLHVKPKVIEGGEEKPLEPAEDGPFLAQVFKVISDPHMGKLCFFRVRRGKLEAKASAYISSTNKPERFANLLKLQGDKRTEIPGVIAGDIACAAKLDELRVGDTIYAEGVTTRLAAIPFPKPMAGYAISPKARGDEQKLSGNIHRLCDEDHTFIFDRNEQTHEQVVRGIGTLHLDVMLKRLKNRFGLEVATSIPKIPYLETITAGSEGSYRHKKQTGGSGQFAEVHLRLKPVERGKGFEFIDAIVGGVISNSFIPSVEKGIRAAMEKGPVAGFPVVDVAAELFYGKEHPVDSKDIAFQLAGRYCFSELMLKCKPVLLEPIVIMEISFPSKYFGDVSGDISQRRGRPTGTDQLGDMQVLKTLVPLAEVIEYGSALNAITQGEGYYSIEPDHYEVVPSNIAQQIAAKAKTEAEEK